MKRKHLLRTVAKTAAIFGLLLVIFWLLPTIGQGLKTTRLHSVFVDEYAALSTYVDALVGQNDDGTTLRCYPEDQGYWQTSAICDEMVDYDYNEYADRRDIATLRQNARALDQQLQKQGWTIDRPQDPYKTLEAGAAYAYDNQLGLSASVEVPYHKNVGPISCNLRIWFEGSHNGGTVPAVNVNDFRCSQNVTYFAPRLHKAHHTII